MAVSAITSSSQHHKASHWKGYLAYLVLIFKTFEKSFPLGFLLQYEIFFSSPVVVCPFSLKGEEDFNLLLPHPKGDKQREDSHHMFKHHNVFTSHNWKLDVLSFIIFFSKLLTLQQSHENVFLQMCHNQIQFSLEAKIGVQAFKKLYSQIPFSEIHRQPLLFPKNSVLC